MKRKGFLARGVFVLLGAIFVVSLLISACGDEEKATPIPSPTPIVTPTATPAVTPTPAATNTPAATQTVTPLFLSILEPADESIVEVSTVTIRGQTLPDAVVSISGQVVDVDSNGNFSLQVTLNDGPNVFDIIATDEEGNEVRAQLMVSLISSITPLFLTILEPANESIVDVNTITIRGQTLPDAVVSIEGKMANVDSNGNFSLRVSLDEGPNVFDIIATDEDGYQATTQLIVSFASIPK